MIEFNIFCIKQGKSANFRKPTRLFLIKLAALGNLKASFHCAYLHSFIPLQKPPPLHSVFSNCLYAPSSPHLRDRNGTQTASL